MMEVTRRTMERTHAAGGHTVTLEGRETRLDFDWRTGGWSWSYQRPRRVYFDDDVTTAVPLRDYVMHTRIAIVLASIALFTIRRS